MDDDFCSENPSNQELGQTRLKEVKWESQEYVDVKRLFKKGWKHRNKRKPNLRAVYKILWPLELLGPYLTYRNNVPQSITLQKDSKSAHERLLFHGTNRACLLGEDPDKNSLCSSPKCFLCSVIRTSFDISQCGSKNKFTRFGTAIYTTACSSKLILLEADDYCVNVCKDAVKRVLLLNRVVVGNEFRTPLNSSHLIEPPKGYHSVVGVPGVHLNYEETVIYHNDAIRPAYILVYDFEPKTKLKAVLRRLLEAPLSV